MTEREKILLHQQLREKMIRERAYYLWSQEGRPDGQQNEFWLRAEHLHLKKFWQDAAIEAHKLAETLKSN